MGFGIFLIHEMYVVRTDEFDAILMSQFNKHFVGLFL